MIEANQFLSHFEEFLRGIVREGIREAQIASPGTNTAPRNRIGGVGLAAEITGMARQTIYNLASRRRIPHSKRDGKLIFSEVELLHWLTENKRPMVSEAAKQADQFIVKPGLRRKRGSAQ